MCVPLVAYEMFGPMNVAQSSSQLTIPRWYSSGRFQKMSRHHPRKPSVSAE